MDPLPTSFAFLHALEFFQMIVQDGLHCIHVFFSSATCFWGSEIICMHLNSILSRDLFRLSIVHVKVSTVFIDLLSFSFTVTFCLTSTSSSRVVPLASSMFSSISSWDNHTLLFAALYGAILEGNGYFSFVLCSALILLTISIYGGAMIICLTQHASSYCLQLEQKWYSSYMLPLRGPNRRHVGCPWLHSNQMV